MLLHRWLLGSELVKGHGPAKGEATAAVAATAMLLRTSRRRSTGTLQAARGSQARWRGGTMGGYASQYSHTGPVRGTMRFLRLVRQPSQSEHCSTHVSAGGKVKSSAEVVLEQTQQRMGVKVSNYFAKDTT